MRSYNDYYGTRHITRKWDDHINNNNNNNNNKINTNNSLNNYYHNNNTNNILSYNRNISNNNYINKNRIHSNNISSDSSYNNNLYNSPNRSSNHLSTIRSLRSTEKDYNNINNKNYGRFVNIYNDSDSDSDNNDNNNNDSDNDDETDEENNNQINNNNYNNNNNNIIPSVVGLRNFGNCCFMNSIIQCLRSTKPLLYYFLNEYKSSIRLRRKGKISDAFADLIRTIENTNEYSYTNPSSFIRVISRKASHFDGYEQQDSGEFMRYLLDKISEDLTKKKKIKKIKKSNNTSILQALTPRRNKSGIRSLFSSSINNSSINNNNNEEELKVENENNNNNKILSRIEQSEKSWNKHLQLNESIITNIFSGQLESIITCKHCGHKSYCFDPFSDLSVPIPETSSSSYSNMNNNYRYGRYSSRYNNIDRYSSDSNLTECIKEYTKSEILDEVNCDQCNTKRRSTKQILIYGYPNILIIELKRFRYTSAYRNKINKSITIPIIGLDLSPYLSPNARSLPLGTNEQPIYDLFAISHHMGGLGGGHYTATVQINDMNWINFNDEHVSRANVADTISGSSPYILFFQRRNSRSRL